MKDRAGRKYAIKVRFSWSPVSLGVLSKNRIAEMEPCWALISATSASIEILSMNVGGGMEDSCPAQEESYSSPLSV